MGEPEQQATSCPLPYQLQSHQRQEAIIGTLVMCLSTHFAQFLIQNIHSWQRSDGKAEFLSVCVMFFMMLAWIKGLGIYFQGFKMNGRSDITARNKGLVYGLGAVNVSLTIIIIWPRINEGTSFAIKVLPAYIGMVIGSL
jgi:hypothetical protein